MNGRALLPLALLALAPSCAAMAHGIAADKPAIVESWDALQARADSAGGAVLGALTAPGLAAGKVVLVITLAAVTGLAHGPEDALEVVGLGTCEECAERRHVLAAARAARAAPPALPPDLPTSRREPEP